MCEIPESITDLDIAGVSKAVNVKGVCKIQPFEHIGGR